ncbi:HlyD family efflux transporter periplasmic adaptor subunit [uncultured Shewanella sp.]|uniref:efflux RND transporter periplasmic adaptor subunit n=1 Tax=uncultured Shewanella sp. TaxID=173975 RepID=UPI0026220EFA|nr:HlyD family efflux transporter periplasmic adaptor subunit [uncultured Shewanella sp.]
MMIKKAKWIYTSLGLTSVSLCIAGWAIGYSQPRQFINAEEIQIAEVRSGTFTQKVDGYGRLESVNQRLISASDSAIVDAILLKPGAIVTTDTVILKLKDPDLKQKLQTTKTKLQNAITDRNKQDLIQQREKLAQEVLLSDVNAEAELATLQVEAETTLAKAGIVSAMEFKRSQVKSRQLKNRENLLQQQITKLTHVHEQQLKLLDDAINQARSDFESIQLQFDNLEVKAGLNGVLQRLPVRLGQSVQAGTELALVGSLNPLIAQIKVPQLQVGLINMGAKADIDSRYGIVTGQVSRIDPVVEDGAVMIDIELPDNINSNIKPMQTVDVVIYGQGRQNVLYLEQPKGIFADSQDSIFLMRDNVSAQKTNVTFGKSADGLIEIKKGLTAGDKVIISALDLYPDTESLQLIH